MTRVTNFRNKKTFEEASDFNPTPLITNNKKRRFNKPEPSAEQLPDNQNQPTNPPRVRIMSHEKREREKVRRRERRKAKKMNCFLCRQWGHSISDCPQNNEIKSTHTSLVDTETPMSGMCYKCSSMEHKSSQCRKKVDPENPYPFAHCFVCNKKGHLAGSCTENDKGLYPYGGGCKHCGSVRHFAKDCKPIKEEGEAIELGMIDLNQGGDDDDVSLAYKRIQQDKKAFGDASSQQSKKSKKNKKVVAF